MIDRCVVQIQIDNKRVSGQPAQLADYYIAVFIRVGRPVNSIFDIAVSIHGCQRQSRQQGVFNQRNVYGKRCVLAVQVAEGAPGGTAQFCGGFDGGIQNSAAGGVFAEQRALRPAQHLDALDLHSIKQRPRGAADIDFVKIDTHAGIRGDLGFPLADTAYIGVAIPLYPVAAATQVQPRHQPLKIPHIGDAKRCHGLARKCRDSNRDDL